MHIKDYLVFSHTIVDYIYKRFSALLTVWKIISVLLRRNQARIYDINIQRLRLLLNELNMNANTVNDDFYLS